MLPPAPAKIHFIGIGGYGMSALALILLKKGYLISGSDLKQSSLTENLVKSGAAVYAGHRAENIGRADLAVYSTAISDENPEIAAVKQRGLPLWHRSELLAALLNSAYGIAIAGAHGKTTTTAMTALLLEAGGLDPTAVIGGVLPAYGSNARLGSGPYLVAEADESDRSFTRYYPRLALVTGIEPDHLEHYDNDYVKLKDAYRIFLSHLTADDTAVLCADDAGLIELAAGLDCRVVRYALNTGPGATDLYHAANIREEGNGSGFDLFLRNKPIARGIKLPVPGDHNISNAVGAYALAHQVGIDPAAVTGGLASFTGVGRRFEIIGTVNGITVVDDYAHHPTEIRATLEAARSRFRRLICLFQPHRYSRTAALFREFSAAFSASDYLLLHSIYPAGEDPVPGISAQTLAGEIRLSSGIPVEQDDDISVLEARAAALAQPGDLIFTMGAGSITYSAPQIIKRLLERS